jgi:cytochrome b561
MNGAGRSRYSLVAIVLHWLIAFAVIATIPLAWWMTDNVSNASEQARVFAAYQLHKSIGLSVLGLTLLRLLWRLAHGAPPLPEGMRGWERRAARLSHFLLYLLMILLPVTGWIYVSAGWNAAADMPFAIPTLWFGQFEWPHIAALAEASAATRSATAKAAVTAHAWMGYGALLLVLLHAGAALKHHVIDRDDVLARMLPLLRPRTSRPTREEQPL